MNVSISSLVLATAPAREASLRRANKNGDGVISNAEREAMSDGRMSGVLFQAREPGKAINLTRARAALTLDAQQSFSVFDRTGDGFIDGNEVRSMSYELQALVRAQWEQAQR